MISKKNANNTGIAFNSEKDKNIAFENEVKAKFMKNKSKNVVFLNEKESLPQFTSFPERQNLESNFENTEGFPKLKQRLFNELSDSTQSYNFPEFRCENNNINSYLFTNKE